MEVNPNILDLINQWNSLGPFNIIFSQHQVKTKMYANHFPFNPTLPYYGNPYHYPPYYPYGYDFFPINRQHDLGNMVQSTETKIERTTSDEIKVVESLYQMEEEKSQEDCLQERKVSIRRDQFITKSKPQKGKSSTSKKSGPGKGIDQKAGRNSYSNILRMFFRRLESKVNSSVSIRSIIEQRKLSLTFEQFKSWYEKNRVDYRNYIKVRTVKKLFKSAIFVKEQTTIMRTLFKEFLQTQALICNLTSKKAKKQVISFNVKSLRLILGEILE